MVSRDPENVARSLGAILVQRFVADCKVFTDRLSSLSEEFMHERQPKNRLNRLMGHIEELHQIAVNQFRDLPPVLKTSSDEYDPVAKALIPFRLAEKTLGATRNRLLELDKKASSPRREFMSALHEAGEHLQELSREARTAFDGIFDAMVSDDHGNIVTNDATEIQSEWTDEKNMRRCELIDKDIAGSISESERTELSRLQTEAIAHRDQVAPLPMVGARQLHRELLRKKSEAESKE